VTHHPIITGSLLGMAVALTILCCLGLMLMRDAYQRVHYSAPVVTISMLLVAIAVFIEESDSQARIKVTLIFVMMLVMNSILSHATARAIRIRQVGQLDPKGEEKIPVLENKGIAGEGAYAGKKS
jgi:monovalent cation/proton antiporter MnhG/PhaG subunit